METKLCSKCALEKPITEFPKLKRNKDSLDSLCKECRNLVNKEYRDNNKDKVKKARKKYYQENKQHLLEQKAVYSSTHKEEKAEYDRVYRQKNKDKLNIQKSAWAKNSLNHKIVNNLRRRVIHALKGESKSDSTLALIGCSIEYLREYLASKFQEGMSWDNYGEWHIDHIRPCCSFNLSDPNQQKECFHYTNLQPLWAIDNLKKAYNYGN